MIFGTQFYPTPQRIAEDMVAEYAANQNGTYRVLDPSCGSGALLSAVQQLFKMDGLALHGVELDPRLAAVSRAIGASVVEGDFLQWEDRSKYNLITMNPPFAAGDKHVLKAYTHLAPGGHLVALLNAETINNPHTATRQSLERLIQDVGGSIEYLGQAFQDADRKTDVEVVMVRLQKPEGKSSHILDDLNPDSIELGVSSDDEPSTMQELADRNIVRNLVQDYNLAVKALREMVAASTRYKQYRMRSTGRGQGMDEYRKFGQLVGQSNTAELLREMTKDAWENLLAKADILPRLSTSVRADFENKFAQQHTVEFNEANAHDLLNTLIAKWKDIQKQSILDAFDLVTRYNAKNKEQGWKTNAAYKCVHRIILPANTIMGKWGWESRHYYRSEEMNDLDRALCVLSGKDPGEVVLATDAIRGWTNKQNRPDGNEELSDWITSEFFKIRVYQVGTAHMTFLDRNLLNEFNRFVALERGWLQTEEPEREWKRKPKATPKKNAGRPAQTA